MLSNVTEASFLTPEFSFAESSLYFLAQRSAEYNIRDFQGKEKVLLFTKMVIFVILEKG